MKIMIVEDNLKMREECARFLEKQGFEVSQPDDFSRIVELVLQEEPQLVLLDINLPVQDGYTICQQLRKASSVPVIVLTSRDSQVDELMSMNLGADDFITKPYHPQILLARVSALLHRTYQAGVSPHLEVRGLALNPEKSEVAYEGQTAELTKNECRILRALMKQPEKIHSREELMNDLWQTDEFVDDNTLTVNINRLRKKLESVGAENFVRTKRGQGYLL